MKRDCRCKSSVPVTPWVAPFLRWAGSKRKLLPAMMASMPARYARYIEPFAGSACLLFAVRPRSAMIGDINRELIFTYQVIREHPRHVARAAHCLRNTSRAYYDLRAANPEDLSPVDRAARFIYLNRHCFNGVYRTNRQGWFNVPRGTRTGQLPSEAHLYRCSVALRVTECRADDFASCVENVRASDFVYLDPPYQNLRRNTSGEYGPRCFDENDLARLIRSLRRIDSLGAYFLLSYSDTATLKGLLPAKWHKRRLRVRRHVAGFAENRRSVYELLVSNYDTSEQAGAE